MVEKTYQITGKANASIYCYYFIPEDEKNINGIIQIVHGLGEHTGRYRNLAKHLTDNGYIVCSEDHRGFGRSVALGEKMGHIADSDGYELILSDMYMLMKKAKADFGDNIDYFLFGHSLGSMLARGFAIKYGSKINGIILSSTKGNKSFAQYFAPIILSLQKIIFGKKAKANLMHKLSVGGYSKKYFAEDKNTSAWLTRDKAEQIKFLKDEYCLNGPSSISTYIEIFNIFNEISDKKLIAKMPKTLPIFLLAGDKDPVCDFSKGVLKLYSLYRQLGFNNVVIKIYKDARHELINEVNRDIVITDLLQWIKIHTKAPIKKSKDNEKTTDKKNINLDNIVLDKCIFNKNKEIGVSVMATTKKTAPKKKVATTKKTAPKKKVATTKKTASKKKTTATKKTVTKK